MSDVCVTVPKTFQFGNAGLVGLAAWISEGDAAGDVLSDERWVFTTSGPRPNISVGDRVYIVCEDRLRGYSRLTGLDVQGTGSIVRLGFERGSAAEAVTIPFRIVGFRGWRYRWWERHIEVPFPDWRTASGAGLPTLQATEQCGQVKRRTNKEPEHGHH